MRICFVGDSFVNGTGDPAYLGWTGRLCIAARQQGYDLTYYNLGIRGETSADILSRWEAEVSRRLSSGVEGRVVFSFGCNDTTVEAGQTRVSVEASLDNTQKILSTASQQYPVLMVGPPPIADLEQNERTADLSQQFGTLCQRLEIPYLDVFATLQHSEVWMREVAEMDGAHPQAAGYAEYAALVQSWSAWLRWFKG